MSESTTKSGSASETLSLKGVVSSGLGEGRLFTSLPWAVCQFENKLGFIPHPGTFNVTVTDDAGQRARKRMLDEPGIVIVPPPGFCEAKCHRVMIDDKVAGAVVIPAVHDYPTDKLEILSPISIRETLAVSDGCEVSLEVAFETVDPRELGELQVAPGRRG